MHIEMTEHEIIAGLNEVKGWNDFAASWSASGSARAACPSQWAAGERMLTKIRPTQAPRRCPRMDVSRIEAL
jgi:hypothetical protein